MYNLLPPSPISICMVGLRNLLGSARSDASPTVVHLPLAVLNYHLNEKRAEMTICVQGVGICVPS